MCLLTEWEGRTEKYLARGQDVRTERTEFFLSFFRGYRRGGPFRAHFEKPMVACNLFGKPVKCI